MAAALRLPYGCAAISETRPGMPTFSDLIESVTQQDGAYAVEAPADWSQGRTVYGGLTAALCANAVVRAVADLPPLRSAQFSFIGPAAGLLRARPTILRRGRSAVIVGVDLEAEAGLATRAILTYGTSRESRINYEGVATPSVLPPEECERFFGDLEPPNFARNFDMRIAAGSRLFSGVGEPAFIAWVRHLEEGEVDRAVALLALADCPPPAAMVHFPKREPISTMTWSMEMLDPAADTPGWRLLAQNSERSADGYSVQALTMWNAAGVPIALGRQTVALFY